MSWRGYFTDDFVSGAGRGGVVFNECANPEVSCVERGQKVIELAEFVRWMPNKKSSEPYSQGDEKEQ